MTTTPTRVAQTPPVPRPDRWHRPLLGLAVLMAASTVVCAVLAVTDPTEILGQNAWLKPLKFSISIVIYTVTLAWLIGQVRRFRRLADIGGVVVVVGLVLEMIIIIGAAAAGTTSHFNVATPLSTTLWVVMAASIGTVWVVTLVVGVLLLLNRGPDPARNVAIAAGVALGLAGMAVAFFMGPPTDAQLNDFQGVAGAHAVGVADGGPGLPFFGWSTTGGDLRVPHFVGMHGLQAVPLGLLALELLSRRVSLLRDPVVRVRLVVVGSLAFAAMLVILTRQALIGQPVIAPSGPVLVAAAATGGAALVAAISVLVTGARR